VRACVQAEKGHGDADALARFVHARHSGLDKVRCVCARALLTSHQERLGEFFGGSDALRQATFKAFLRGCVLLGVCVRARV
jgi:hypothetical protein